MSKETEAYLDLIADLRFVRAMREARGESLPQSEEVKYIAALDRLWNQMSDGEQDYVETERTREAAPEAPAELPDVDVDVEVGSVSAPRRAA